MSAPTRRPRVARRALRSARRAPATGSPRERIASALACCSASERHVLALLIEERLTPAETAVALELSLAQVLNVQATLLDELSRVLGGRPFRRTRFVPAPVSALRGVS